MLLRHIKFAGVKVRVPSHPILRMILGIALIIGGFLGFLPILGFWMLPLGLVVLSIDFAFIRRFRRRASVQLGRWMLRRWPRIARRIGFGT
jgi:purine-cytosine permease-like protein